MVRCGSGRCAKNGERTDGDAAMAGGGGRIATPAVPLTVPMVFSCMREFSIDICDAMVYSELCAEGFLAGSGAWDVSGAAVTGDKAAARHHRSRVKGK